MHYVNSHFNKWFKPEKPTSPQHSPAVVKSYQGRQLLLIWHLLKTSSHGPRSKTAGASRGPVSTRQCNTAAATIARSHWSKVNEGSPFWKPSVSVTSVKMFWYGDGVGTRASEINATPHQCGKTPPPPSFPRVFCTPVNRDWGAPVVGSLVRRAKWDVLAKHLAKTNHPLYALCLSRF